MKLLLLTLILMVPLMGYSETMIIHRSDGTTAEFYTDDITEITFNVVSVEDFANFITKVPIEFVRNYPNPFNPTTVISFQLNKPQITSVEIFNLKGQKVKQLVNGLLETGTHNLTWNGKDDYGKPAASGTYFYQIKTPEKNFTKKMLLLK